MRKITFWLVIAAIIAISGSYVMLDSSGTTIGRLVAIPAVLSWILYKIETRRFRSWGAIVITLATFIGYAALSSFWSVDDGQTLYGVQRLCTSFLLVMVIWDLGITRKEAEGIFQAYIAASYVGFLTILYQVEFSHKVYEDRYSVVGFDPNTAGFLAVLGLPIAWYLGNRKFQTNQFFGTINKLYPIVPVGVTVLTASRSSFIVLIIALVYMLHSARKVDARMVFSVGAAAVLFLAAGFGGLIGPLTPQFQRLATTVQSASEDGGNGRVESNLIGLDVFAKHPIVGTGYLTSAVMSLQYPTEHQHGLGVPTHNGSVQVLGDLGIIGLSMIVVLMYLFFRTSKTMPPAAKLAARYTLAVFIVGHLLGPEFFEMTNWVFMAIFATWIASFSLPEEAPVQLTAAQSPLAPAKTTQRAF